MRCVCLFSIYEVVWMNVWMYECMSVWILDCMTVCMHYHYHVSISCAAVIWPMLHCYLSEAHLDVWTHHFGFQVAGRPWYNQELLTLHWAVHRRHSHRQFGMHLTVCKAWIVGLWTFPLGTPLVSMVSQSMTNEVKKAHSLRGWWCGGTCWFIFQSW